MEDMIPLIDAHAHCGREDRYPPQDLRDYISHLGRSGIEAAIMFPPVSEIYDRYDPDFQDTDQWRDRRRESNEYLLGISGPEFTVYPFFSIRGPCARAEQGFAPRPQRRAASGDHWP